MLWRVAHRRGGGREGGATRTLCRGRSGGRAEGSRRRVVVVEAAEPRSAAPVRSLRTRRHPHPTRTLIPRPAAGEVGRPAVVAGRGGDGRVGGAGGGESIYSASKGGGHPRSKGRGTVGRQPSGRWNRQRADERHTHAPHERGGARLPHEAARDQRGRPSGEARWYCMSTRALRSPSLMIGGRGVNVPVRRGRPSGGVAWKTGLAASTGRRGGGRTSDQRWGCPYIPRARREALCAGAMAEGSRGQCVCSLVWGGGCVGRRSKSSAMDRAQAGREGKGRGRGTPPGRPSL